MSFSIQQINRDSHQIVSVSGYMGSDECHRVEKCLLELLGQKHRRVILDCEMLTFVTSASLARLFVSAREFRRHSGQTIFAGLSPSASRMAEMVGFDKKTELLPDVTAALKSVSRDSAPSGRRR